MGKGDLREDATPADGSDDAGRVRAPDHVL